MRTKKIKMPTRLIGAAADKWVEVAPTLALNNPIDVETLASYCEQWALYMEIREAYDKQGKKIITDNCNGTMGENPYLKAMRSALDQMAKAEKRFTYIVVTKDEKKKEW